MIALTIDVKDRISPMLANLRRGLEPGNIAKPIGQGVAALFKAHFTALNTARANTLGGQRTNFYRRAANATRWEQTGDGVTIVVEQQGIAQRYFGGKIAAKPGKALTIPADPEAYGKRAGEFNDLKLVVFARSGRAALVKAMATNIRLGKKGVKAVSSQRERVMYWLVKSVTQEKDPTVIPTEAAIRGAAVIAVRNHLAAREARLA